MEGADPVAPWSSACPSIVVECVKLAEDRSGDLVVRIYEARGAQAMGTVAFGCDVESIIDTDLLERTLDDPTALIDVTHSQARLRLRPFQIVTLRDTHNRRSETTS